MHHRFTKRLLVDLLSVIKFVRPIALSVVLALKMWPRLCLVFRVSFIKCDIIMLRHRAAS